MIDLCKPLSSSPTSNMLGKSGLCDTYLQSASFSPPNRQEGAKLVSEQSGAACEECYLGIADLFRA